MLIVHSLSSGVLSRKDVLGDADAGVGTIYSQVIKRRCEVPLQVGHDWLRSGLLLQSIGKITYLMLL